MNLVLYLDRKTAKINFKKIGVAVLPPPVPPLHALPSGMTER
jgi:hypothetical protein